MTQNQMSNGIFYDPFAIDACSAANAIPRADAAAKTLPQVSPKADAGRDTLQRDTLNRQRALAQVAKDLQALTGQMPRHE